MSANSLKVLVIALNLVFPLFSIAQDADAGVEEVYKGLAKLLSGDIDGAIEGYDRAIEINPALANAYVNRGAARQIKDDMDAALADYNQALVLSPDYADAYQARGSLSYVKRNWDEALKDYKRSCELSEKDRDYTHIFIWLIQTRQGETETAHKELADYLEKQRNSEQETWATKIAGYLLGRISEAELLAAAKSTNDPTEQGQLCELWYYAGMKKLLAGSKAGAGVYFRKCLATKIKIFVEYQFAEAELKALGQ
ncbi:hypothetical protein BH11VER1_BH11VER1_30510 [soil metagenome]